MKLNRLGPRLAIAAMTLLCVGVASGAPAGAQAVAEKAASSTATPPSAVTGSARSVTFASAVLTGTVNPHGSSTNFYFQYGTTAAYGMQTSSASAGAGTADVSVTGSVSGLAPATAYHYRVVAVSTGGTVTGVDRTFTTAKRPPPTAVTGAATSVGGSSAVLNGTVNPRGAPTTYYFQYGTTPGYGAHTAPASAGAGTATVPVSSSVAGLAPATRYHYRLVAVGPGSTVTGRDRSFTTAKVPLALTIASTRNPVGAGGTVVVDGAITGTGAQGRKVILQANPFPYTQGYRQIGVPKVTNAAGRVAFTIVGLNSNTLLRAVSEGSPQLVSSVLAENVRVRVSLHVRVRRTRTGLAVRLSGFVAPAGANVRLSIQKRVHGRWVRVAVTPVRPFSPALARYSRTLHRLGLYRVFARALDGSLLSGASRRVRARAP